MGQGTEAALSVFEDLMHPYWTGEKEKRDGHRNYVIDFRQIKCGAMRYTPSTEFLSLRVSLVKIVKFDQFAGHRKDYPLANIYDAVGGAFQVMSDPHKVACAFDVPGVGDDVSDQLAVYLVIEIVHLPVFGGDRTRGLDVSVNEGQKRSVEHVRSLRGHARNIHKRLYQRF